MLTIDVEFNSIKTIENAASWLDWFDESPDETLENAYLRLEKKHGKEFSLAVLRKRVKGHSEKYCEVETTEKSHVAKYNQCHDEHNFENVQIVTTHGCTCGYDVYHENLNSVYIAYERGHDLSWIDDSELDEIIEKIEQLRNHDCPNLEEKRKERGNYDEYCDECESLRSYDVDDFTYNFYVEARQNDEYGLFIEN